MMQKLLIVVGATATGKTSLGRKLAQLFQGELISADSRQVYQGMDIGTGKDLPVNLTPRLANQKWRGKSIKYYTIDGVTVWGYDLVKPDEEFNVAFFTEIAWKVIQDIWERGRLPILVGGTGLYIKAITDPFTTLATPPDRKWRREAEHLTLEQLKARLERFGKMRFNKMNNSDRNNKRRLIRAIELERNKTPEKETGDANQKQTLLKKTSIMKVGLTAPKPVLFERIDERVERRIQQGAETEIRQLVRKGYTFDLPSMSAMGFRQWRTYIEGKETKEDVLKRWKFDERDYARRQLTWFKKDSKIRWFDIAKPDWQKRVVRLVREWYYKPDS